MAFPDGYQNKWILITGASMGIGEMFARKLAHLKANLFLTARSMDRLRRLSDQLSKEEHIQAIPIPCDLSDPKGPLHLYSEILKQGVPVFGLINNAGNGVGGPFVSAPVERHLNTIDLNVRALVELTHLFLPDMLKRKEGFVINVSSTAAYQPVPYFASYAASKSFVTSFTESLWLETQNSGVRVLNFCPGLTKTEFGVNAGMRDFKLDPMAAEVGKVVDTALRSLNGNAPTAISGWQNKLLILIERLLPHRVVLYGSLLVQNLRGRKGV